MRFYSRGQCLISQSSPLETQSSQAPFWCLGSQRERAWKPLLVSSWHTSCSPSRWSGSGRQREPGQEVLRLWSEKPGCWGQEGTLMHHSNLSSRSPRDLKQWEKRRPGGCLSGKGSLLDCKEGWGVGVVGAAQRTGSTLKTRNSNIFFARGYSLSASLYLIRDMEGMVSAPESSWARGSLQESVESPASAHGLDRLCPSHPFLLFPFCSILSHSFTPVFTAHLLCVQLWAVVFIRGDLSLVGGKVSAQDIEGKIKQRFVWDPKCMKQKSGARGREQQEAGLYYGDRWCEKAADSSLGSRALLGVLRISDLRFSDLLQTWDSPHPPFSASLHITLPWPCREGWRKTTQLEQVWSPSQCHVWINQGSHPILCLPAFTPCVCP